MKQPSFCGQELLSIYVIEVAGFAEPGFAEPATFYRI